MAIILLFNVVALTFTMISIWKIQKVLLDLFFSNKITERLNRSKVGKDLAGLVSSVT